MERFDEGAGIIHFDLPLNGEWSDVANVAELGSLDGRNAAMTENERRLIDLLEKALKGDLEKGIREFEEYYWPFERGVLPWDSELDRAIHDLATELEFFEPDSNRRLHPFYEHDELRNKIREVLALLPSEEKSD